jgi:hypothetical protein
MGSNARTAVCLLAGMVFTNACFGQEEQSKRAETPQPQPRFYKLEFVVKELEKDKVINSRVYATSLSANTREGASIRAGSRIPVATTTSNPSGGPASKQYNYYDVGVNIDCRDARELPSGQVTLFLSVDVSNVVGTNETGGDLPPLVRNTKWSSAIVISVRKTTTVFSSDDPSGNRKMQLDITATPIT